MRCPPAAAAVQILLSGHGEGNRSATRWREILIRPRHQRSTRRHTAAHRPQDRSCAGASTDRCGAPSGYEPEGAPLARSPAPDMATASRGTAGAGVTPGSHRDMLPEGRRPPARGITLPSDPPQGPSLSPEVDPVSEDRQDPKPDHPVHRSARPVSGGLPLRPVSLVAVQGMSIRRSRSRARGSGKILFDRRRVASTRRRSHARPPGWCGFVGAVPAASRRCLVTAARQAPHHRPAADAPSPPRDRHHVTGTSSTRRAMSHARSTPDRTLGRQASPFRV